MWTKPALYRRVLPSAFLVICGQVAAAASPEVVLDETCYLRRYLRFGVNRYSPAALRAEGEKVLGKGGLDRLRRETEKAIQQKGMDVGKVDWRDHVFQPMHANFTASPAPAPPDDWASPDFDDSAWVCRRLPFQGARPAAITSPNLGQFDESMDLGLQGSLYRARFMVDDPEKAGGMTLRLTYSGGVRAFLNGQEVARGHLPAGKPAADAPGEDYPAAAYGEAGKALRERTIGPVQIAPAHLRKGVNVLAIEVHPSYFHPVVLTNPRQPNWGGPIRPWPHARLTKFELRCRSAGVRSALVRPGGVQVWAADMHHRVDSTEFLPAGERPGTVRFTAARNGTYSAQVVIGADKALGGVQVSCTELTQGSGKGRLPADAVKILHMAPYPLEEWTMKRLGDERGLGAAFPDAKLLAAYASMGDPKKACVFDHLTEAPPKSIPANTCRPVWLSLQVPPDAAPGRYQGSVKVAAEGMSPAEAPVELEIVDWGLPKPGDFQTLAGCEQNPYGVARQYGVKPWSQEHFRLLEASFRQLGRVGNKWLNVPVIANTEFGNKDDSMIAWIRRKDRSLAFDYAVLDRYLDLAIRYCGGPRVINVVVMQGMRSPLNPPSPPQVKVVDEATSRASLVPVGTDKGGAETREAWRALATSLYGHMKARPYGQAGLGKSMYWGSPLEAEADPELKNVLSAFTPDVYWTAGPHEMMSNGTYAKNEKFYKVVTTIRYWGGWPSFRTDQGWKSKTLHLLNPRVGGTVFAMHTTSHPFAYRILPDHAVSFGRSGFTRVGADEWAGVHYDGMTTPKWLTGIPVLFTLWPGAQGAESSARFEALIEGLQEAEARIFLEQALDRGKVPQDLAAKVRKVLSENLQETMFFEGNSIIHAFEEYHYHWQERSGRLYRAAAEVARLVGPQR